MKPIRHNPKNQESLLNGGTRAKGDHVMGRIATVAAAIIALTASWVCAGNFEALADASSIMAPTPLYIKSGALIKAEYKPGLKTASDQDTPRTQTVAASADRAGGRPGIAYKERSVGAMAPPPRMESSQDSSRGLFAEAKQDSFDLESDLEKDLVLSPPPAKSEERIEAKPVVEKKAPQEKVSVNEAKASKKDKPASGVRKVTPPAPVSNQNVAGSGKPIHKVRPVTAQDPWKVPAGSYAPRAMTNIQAPIVISRPLNVPAPQELKPVNMPYANSAPRPTMNGIVPSDRIVRDGITIKLAPAAAPAPVPQVQQPYPYEAYQENTGDDLLSTAAEIIGMPFAFISSLF